MIVLDLELKGIYGFNDFHINFSYPKKIVNSIIDQEYLKGRERFRYKKAVILMGANATGKTSLGKALLRIFGYMTDGNPTPLYDMVAGDKGYFSIDFVNGDYRLQRLSAQIDASNQEIDIQYQTADIDTMDSYEKCVKKLKNQTIEATRTATALKKMVGAVRYRFAYPEIEKSLKLTGANISILLKTLRAVIGTLDPTLQDVSLSKDLKDTFIIRRGGTEIIIQEGKLLNREILSSGTAEGIDVAMFLAAMATKESSFYYCDEHFSYIQSDIEKRIFGIMLDRIGDDEQLIFTTHNTDMLDLNLPKHSYVFLRKHLEEDVYQVSAVSASDVLKRNTDSLRCAVENDVFASLPQDSLLDELEMRWEDEQKLNGLSSVHSMGFRQFIFYLAHKVDFIAEIFLCTMILFGNVGAQPAASFLLKFASFAKFLKQPESLCCFCTNQIFNFFSCNTAVFQCILKNE